MTGRMSSSGLRELRDKLERNCTPQQIDKFFVSCAKRIAGQLLRDVVKRTPIGHYDGNSYVCETGIPHKGRKVEGKQGGKLASSWTVGEVEKNGKTYSITIKNNALSDTGVPYAIYVEHGHRTKKKDGYGWVEGHKMLAITVAEIKDVMPDVLERRLIDFLRGCIQ